MLSIFTHGYTRTTPKQFIVHACLCDVTEKGKIALLHKLIFFHLERTMEKICHCIYCFVLFEKSSQTCALGFIRGSKDLKTIKAHGLQPCSSINFLVFGTPDETLPVTFEILLGNWYRI
ncbi:hypothetical protein AWC38_SpisGene25798 [Stylophora pistillata]|uniref:Uncharacterized protein n=1 Tax=Stylophora pistillata TaxID=50429 RepID=A0A2B4SHT4_STYPI|nr:hypothetical protein AWC38_SpisGene25798 [Stylophora pistillata]